MACSTCGASPWPEETHQNSSRSDLTSTGGLGALSHSSHSDHFMDLGAQPVPLFPLAAFSLEGWLLPYSPAHTLSFVSVNANSSRNLSFPEASLELISPSTDSLGGLSLLAYHPWLSQVFKMQPKLSSLQSVCIREMYPQIPWASFSRILGL